jgi:hypothetical protein
MQPQMKICLQYALPVRFSHGWLLMKLGRGDRALLAEVVIHDLLMSGEQDISLTDGFSVAILYKGN